MLCYIILCNVILCQIVRYVTLYFNVCQVYMYSLWLASGCSTFCMHISRGGLKRKLRWAGAPSGKKNSAKFRRKSRPHPLEFFVRTPWNFPSVPLR
ncbi:hypothetical protein HanXRQr2_Chr04g0140911 [Helianthus annuus]|uniref:Uncharacterized protein n=1 Tax=Helianthus annuus TaxID=4232 RepID=A0A9K3NP98_HELAN|nr:hypothetical protein HanXRQr2_Chr04g0140911 [Helianthus annuus]KAJ0929372.1 hypothetical protein HanPSC8_Chr04g0136911 [Helianthus annuus]